MSTTAGQLDISELEQRDRYREAIEAAGFDIGARRVAREG